MRLKAAFLSFALRLRKCFMGASLWLWEKVNSELQLKMT